jgi:solute carrier family 35, member F5
VACIWAGASVLIQYIYSDLSFESPFVLTFICTALFAVYLPGVLCLSRLGLAQNPPFRDTPSSSTAAATEGGGGGGGRAAAGVCYTPIGAAQDGLPLRDAAAITTMAADDADVDVDGEGEDEGVEGGPATIMRRKPPQALWSHVRTMRVSAVVFPLFFVANFAYNLSLAHTSVTSNTIISTTASLWTFLFRYSGRE